MPFALVKVYSVTASPLNVPNDFSVIPILVVVVVASVLFSVLLLQENNNIDAARISDDNCFIISYRFYF